MRGCMELPNNSTTYFFGRRQFSRQLAHHFVGRGLLIEMERETHRWLEEVRTICLERLGGTLRADRHARQGNGC